MARDLVQVMTGHPLEDIAVDIQLPPNLNGPIQALRAAQGAAADADAAAREAQRVAATALREAGAPLRDIASTLGISHQRVHQVLADADARALRLDSFQATVNQLIASGAFRTEDLVVDDAGEHNVIAVLGDGLLSRLVDQLRTVGGYATVFALSPSGAIRSASFVRSECAIGDPGDDLTGDSRPGQAALVDTFIDYVLLHPRGVRFDSVAEDSCAKDARTLQDA